MRAKRNFKGFVFTLDAVFALIVAIVGVSILVYLDYTGGGASYGIAASRAPAMLQSMLSTTIAGTAGSRYIGSLATSALGSTSTWKQFGGSETLSSSTEYAPHAPYLLYTFSAPSSTALLPDIVAGDGLAIAESGSNIYIFNASTGNSVTSISYGSGSGAYVNEAPAIYKGTLFYPNNNKVVRAVSIYGNYIEWSFNSSNTITSPIEIENNHVAFGTANGFYLLDSANGNSIAFANTGSAVQAPTYAKGAYIITTTTPKGGIYSYSLIDNSLVETWNVPLTYAATNPCYSNGTIAVGSGDYLYIFTIGGNLKYKSNDLSSKILGIASYGNDYYVQTENSIYAFTEQGNTIFAGKTATNANAQNSVPSAGPGEVYMLINGNRLMGYNTSRNVTDLNISLQSAYAYSGYSNIGLAYGNMYVPNGNTVYVFGTYKPDVNDNLLHAMASMYLSNQGGYANIALQGLYNASMSGIFLNGTYAPDTSIATFNSMRESYVEETGGLAWMDNGLANFSITIWIDPSSGNGIIVDGLGQAQKTGTWHNAILEIVNGKAYAGLPGSGLQCLLLGRVPSNRWSSIAITYNGNVEYGYINGVEANSIIAQRSVPGNGALMYYPLGMGDSNNCGSSDYFTGSMLDYQIYNETLNQSNVAKLYNGGAFSAPAEYSHIALWLPLVGNSNDFSGAYNFGISHNIDYTKVSYVPVSLSNAYQVSKATVPMFLDANGIIKEYNVSVVTWR